MTSTAQVRCELMGLREPSSFDLQRVACDPGSSDGHTVGAPIRGQ
jgi:hypothetical protein